MADLLDKPNSAMEISPTAVRWTRNDCEAFERAGILTYRYELVEGVINGMGQGLPHIHAIRMLIAWLISAIGIEFFCSQATIDVRVEDNSINGPDPDAVILNRPASSLTGIPAPADIRLLVEAADSTLRYDLTTKAALYARAEIVEYWVVSIPERKLYVHRFPEDGVYREIMEYSEDDTVVALGMPQLTVKVANLLPTTCQQ